VGKAVEVDGELIELPVTDGKPRREVQGSVMPLGTQAGRDQQEAAGERRTRTGWTWGPIGKGSG
jgi:hypothetical protein